MIKKIRYKLLYIDLTIILSIILILLYSTDYTYGQMIQTGDLRLHLDSRFMGDQFMYLFSNRYSNNNYVYLSILPLFKIFTALGYNLSILYLYIGIFITSYLSLKYSLLFLLKEFNLKTNIYVSIFISSLAFFFSLNPYSLNRIGHYTVLHSLSLYPLLYLYLAKIIKNSKIQDYFIFFLVLFFSNSSPQNLILNVLTIISFPVLYLILYSLPLKKFIIRYLNLTVMTILTLMHILIPTFLGMGVTKSIFESPTDANVLKSLSRHSNLITSLSGTNYYYDELLKYPYSVSLGLVLFFLLLASFLYLKNYKDKFVLLNILYLMGFTLIIGGYNTYPLLFEFFTQNKLISTYLWVIKDPNMYYGFFVFYLSLVLVYQATKIDKYKLILNLSIIFIIFNLSFNIFTDTKNYKAFYDFIPIPTIYDDFILFNNKSEYRNLWLPYNTYISKNYSNNIYYFPIPSFWLSNNKELTEYTIEYKYLIDTIEEEIYYKDCVNKNFISWLVKTNNLKIVIDNSTVNHPHINEDDTLEKLLKVEKCMYSIETIVEEYNDNTIKAYISNLSISDEVYKVIGDKSYLIDQINSKPSNVFFKPTGDPENFTTVKLANDVYILNESYDTNWRDSTYRGPLYKINLVNMAFENDGFTYKGVDEFKIVLFIQDLLLIVSVFYIFYTIISRNKK